ncbi:hypothetical protein [Streptococcus sp. FT1-106]|uniref:hypothetical protein n=1 Tax=Streptococcus sp. FT1-106 TaxID=3409994 RepID=UPI003BF56F36
MKIFEFDYWVERMKDKALSISEWCTNYLNHTQELEKGTKLKILDNKDYLRDGAIRMFIKGIAFAAFFAVLGTVIVPRMIPSDLGSSIHLAVIFLTCSFFFIFLAYSSLVFAFLRYLKTFSIILSMLIVAFISGGLVYSLGDENKKVSDYICCSCPSVQSLPPSSSNSFEKALQSVFIKYELGDLFTDNAWQFWVIVIMILGISCLSSYLIVKSLEIFDIEIVKKGNEIVLLPLGVLTFIIGVELEKVSPIGMFLLSLLIQTAFITWYAGRRLKKESLKAQDIFQTQLLSTAPNYKELKKCYYHGGEKYKEKMLSDRKFLEVILKNESEISSVQTSLSNNKRKTPPRRVRRRKKNNYASHKIVSKVSTSLVEYKKIKSFFSIFH